MAKVQDITTTQVYRDIVERDKPDTLDEIIGIAGVVKEVINDPVTKNLTNLQEKGIFDKALMSSRLKQFKANQTELERIESEFGGSVYNYANARNKKAIEQAIAQRYNVGPDVKFTIGNPDMVYGEILENMNKKSVEAIEKLQASQASLGVSGVDMDDIGTYLDEKHAAAFKNLQEEFTITGSEIIGQLFGKSPYNRASIDEMKDYISKQAYTKEFTKIEDVNNTYRTLFNFDPTVAAEFEEIIKNADLRFNVESKASPIKTRTIKGPKGNDIIETYKTIDTQYTDNKGVLQVESNEIVLTSETQEFSLEGHNLMQKLILGDSGLQEYFRLVEEEGYSPRRAFDRLPRKYKKSMSDLNKEALYNDQFNNIATAFKDYKDLNYYEGTMGGQFGTTTLTIKKEVQEYLDYLKNPTQYKKENDNKVPPKPSYFYKNIEEFARGEYDIGPVKSELSENNINTSANSYILNDSLSDNIRYQNFVGNPLVMGQNLNDIFEGDVAEKIEELNLKFDNGIKTNFVKGSSVYVNPNEPDVTPEELIELGLDDTLPAGNYKLGYDIKTDTLQLVSMSGEQVQQPPEVEETVETQPITEEGVYDTLLEVPGLGDTAEFVFGTKLNTNDKLLIAGIGGSAVYAGGVNPTKRRLGMALLNNAKNKDAIKAVTDVTQKVNQANYGFKTKSAFNSWKSKLTPFQQAVFKSVSKTGKTINPSLLATNYIPKTAVVRVPVTGIKTLGSLAKNILFRNPYVTLAATGLTIANSVLNFLNEEDTEAEAETIKDSQ